MDEFDLPIFKKSYDLYKLLARYRALVPKQDRYTLWQRSENTLLDVLEHILLASQLRKEEKLSALERASVKIGLLRVFLRLAKETRALDNKKYTLLQEPLDEIGRMLGGWIRATKTG